MKVISYCYFLILVLALACTDSRKEVINSLTEQKIIEVHELNTLLDNSKLEGAILIYDVQLKQYFTNSLELAIERKLPASTFKIPNTVIGLETGLLEDANSIFKWDGRKRNFPHWEKDLSLKEAFQVSCVPCYQELALKIGVDTMKAYLEKLSYEDMSINQESLNRFWLIGDSKISPMEQIDFLRRLYNSELKISSKTTAILKDIMLIDSNENYTLSGKTGRGIFAEKTIGWFVGYLESNEEIYFYATAITPKVDFDMDGFNTQRKEVTMEAFKKLQIL